ncbi:hypothetical protein BDN70DRAFT_413802 [Pholiota conissans]|uniref:FAR-17a/AIG1-like protein n=1 Tax=Pholiota conissans TaxID=109636 RepID=A0A9P5YPJ9_9AGAR|nr:hypothetical protein BDN70DRAFT_413802 [Pholiota conissans]
MFRLNFYSRLGVPQDVVFDAPHAFVTSPIFRSPIVFASIRMIIALYTATTLLVTLIWNAVILHDAQSYFSFFTYLTYIGLCAYYFAAGVQTLLYALYWRKAGAGVGYPLQRWPKFLQALHVVLHSTVVTFPILVTIVFWALLSDPATFASTFSSWSNISVHALNTVFAAVEILASNSPPPPWLTLPLDFLLLASYLGVAYITHATQGIYTYSFLDPKKQGAKLAAYIFGIGVAEVIVFCVIRGVMVLRQRWAVRSGRVLGGNGEREANIEEGWEEVESPTVAKPSKGGMEPDMRVLEA